MNRWIVAVASIIACIGPGALYSFNLFSPALMAAFNWSPEANAIGFGLGNFMLGIGAASGGPLVDRFGPRYVAIAGALCWGFGNILLGLLAPAIGLPALFLAYSLLGGFGTGLVYIAAIGAVIKNFPKRRGFSGGLVVMGFGLGAFVFNTLVTHLTDFPTIGRAAAAFVSARNSAAEAFATFKPDAFVLSGSQIAELMHVFVGAGIAFTVVGIAVSFLLPRVPTVVESSVRDVGTREMLASPQFYILWATLLLNVSAGIIIVGNAPAIMQELSGASAAEVSGLFAFLTLFNAFGRLLWGTISDAIGRRTTFALMFTLQVVAFFGLSFTHSLALAAIGVSIVLLCYGGGFGTMPAYNSDYFGLRNLGANYGLNLTAWGCAALAGPSLLQAVRDLTGTYAGALEPTAILLSVAIIFPIISEAVRREPAQQSIVPDGGSAAAVAA